MQTEDTYEDEEDYEQPEDVECPHCGEPYNPEDGEYCPGCEEEHEYYCHICGEHQFTFARCHHATFSDGLEEYLGQGVNEAAVTLGLRESLTPLEIGEYLVGKLLDAFPLLAHSLLVCDWTTPKFGYPVENGFRFILRQDREEHEYGDHTIGRPWWDLRNENRHDWSKALLQLVQEEKKPAAYALIWLKTVYRPRNDDEQERDTQMLDTLKTWVRKWVEETICTHCGHERDSNNCVWCEDK